MTRSTLLSSGIGLAADRALPVRRVHSAIRITEEGPPARPSVAEWRRGQFVFCGSAEIARAGNHIAEGITIFDAVRQVGIQQPRRFLVWRAAQGLTEIRKRFGQTLILVAVRFDGGR